MKYFHFNEIFSSLSFAGTVAWMAPEIIRNEPCNEKVDIWSFGVCVWELLTCEVPYKNVDSSAIIWGVGSNALQLPLPSSCPEGFKLLIKQCWSSKPRNRPSFKHILMHLDIAAVEILSYKPEDYFRTQQSWKVEVMEHNEQMKCEESSIPVQDEAMIKKRQEELQHAQDVRELYERKLERTTNLYLELNAAMLRIEQRELEIGRREEKVKSSERVLNLSSRKKTRPTVRLPRKTEMATSLRSTSPDSPTIIGAAAVKPGLVERSEPRPPQSGQYHPTVEKLQQKKSRSHRRTGSGSLTPRTSPRSSPKQGQREVTTQTDLPEEETDLRSDRSDYFSMSRQTSGRRSDKSLASFNTYQSSQCCCPGCPGNPGTVKDSFMDGTEDQLEDQLEDLDKKVSEMMIRDGSRRSSHHDLARKVTRADLVGFEDEKVESSSSEMMESSQEDLSLSQNWSEDDDQFVLKRGR